MIKPKHYPTIVREFLLITSQLKDNFKQLQVFREQSSGHEWLIFEAYDDKYAAIEFKLKNDTVLLKTDAYMKYKHIKKIQKLLKEYDR